jgi:mRNA interferase RelE/StbE
MWSITLETQAAKFLRKAEKSLQEKIYDYLRKVMQNPKLHGEPLVGGFKGLWRYRVGDYRIICELKDKEMVILVVKIGHRKDIYN